MALEVLDRDAVDGRLVVVVHPQVERLDAFVESPHGHLVRAEV